MLQFMKADPIEMVWLDADVVLRVTDDSLEDPFVAHQGIRFGSARRPATSSTDPQSPTRSSARRVSTTTAGLRSKHSFWTAERSWKAAPV